jgi:uncharacterized protein YlzI (FlbEa/FlbD family)
MHSFIKVHAKRNGRLMLVNTNSIERVGTDDEGDTVVITRNDFNYIIKESIDDVWEMLKPNIIFA